MSNIHPPPDNSYNLPKVGETRCYWTLLNSALEFIYTDPVLTYHLKDQAPKLVGRKLLDFVHPEEQLSAREDFAQGQKDREKGLWGSETRVRFCRLSRVLQMLGHTGPAHQWPDADKIAYDEHYMAVDIVLNWAAEDLILCFLHASMDLKPADNDQRHKTPWTNWCGTPVMDQKHIEDLFNRLQYWDSHRQPHHSNAQYRRVFQILGNQPNRPLLLNWPPEQASIQMALASAVNSAPIDVETQERYSGTFQNGTASHAKTTCTRRYSAQTSVSPGNGGEQLQAVSIFIPHGTIIFACHEVFPQAMPHPSTSPRSRTSSSTSPPMQVGYTAPPAPISSQRSVGYNSSSSTYYQTPQAPSQYPTRYPPINYAFNQTSYPPPPPPPSWNNDHHNSPSSYTGGQHWGSPAHSTSPLPAPAVSNLRSGSESYTTNGHNSSNSTSGPPSPWTPSQPTHHSSQQFMEPPFAQPSARSASPVRYSTANSTAGPGVPGSYAPASPLPALQTLPPPGQELAGLGSPGGDVVPPSRRRVSPHSTKSDHGHSPYPSPASLSGTSPSETGRTGSGRYTKAQGVMKCSSCKTTSSPEWRKGPSGKKELCNACGLRYARSRAKKDGQPPAQRRRKDKAASIKRDPDSMTPPIASGTPPHSAASYSRTYDYRDAGSGYRDPALPPPTSSPNTDLYPPPPPSIHSHSQSLADVLAAEESKVAPSPPPSSVGSYLQKHGYTNIPSPLSAHPPISSSILDHHPSSGSGAPSPAPLQLQHSHSSTSGPGITTQLPPFSYVDRMHPSPISHSPLSAGVHTPASFERDNGSRELPLPVVGRRSVLTQP